MNRCQRKLLLINQHFFFFYLGLILLSFAIIFAFKSNNKEVLHPTCKIHEKVFKVSLSREVLPKPVKKIVKKQKQTPKKIVKPIQKKVEKKVEPIIKEAEPIIEEVLVQESIPIQKNIPTPKEVIKTAFIPPVEKTVFNPEKKESFLSELREIIAKNKKYPRMAKRMKKEGISIIAFLLKKSGNIVNVVLEKSCGHSIIDKAALHLVSSIISYKPIPDDVSLVDLEMLVPIAYNIK